MRNFLGVLFLITIAFSAFCQSDDSKDFKDQYLEQRTLLLSNFHLKEQALNEESKMLSQLNDTQLVLHDLLFFDINEINKNNNLLKDLGHKLKSKEILFNTYSIKSFIELRYLKTLSLEKQDETFSSTFKSIVTNAKQNRDFYSLSQAYMANAEHKININQRDSVLYYINLAVANARKQTQKSLLTDVILNQAELYRRLKNDESAISKAYLALQLSVENKYNYGVYQANIILAMINEQHESTAEMKRNLKQARDAAKAMNFQEGVLFTTLFELQSKNEYTPEDYKTILSIKKATQVPLELQAMIATIESQMFIFSGNYKIS